MSRKLLLAATVIVGAAALSFLVFYRMPETPAPLPMPPRVPSCALDGGQPFRTLTLTLCIPPGGAVTTKTAGDQAISTISIPSIIEPLTIVSAPLMVPDELIEISGPPIMERIQEKPVVSNSVCLGFRVVDARWNRADGWLAREITTIGVAFGYRWSPPSVAQALDQILEKTQCQALGVASTK